MPTSTVSPDHSFPIPLELTPLVFLTTSPPWVSANPLDSDDILENLHFDWIFHLDDLSGDLDDCLCCAFHMNDDCLRGPCNLHMLSYIFVYYLYYNFCEYLGYGALVYFGVHSYFGHPLDGCYHNDHDVCHVCFYCFRSFVPVHRYMYICV